VIGERLATLARQRDFAYLKAMAQPVSSPPQIMPQSRSPSGVGSVIAWGAAGLGGMVVLGALVLWFHYGTAVFFEMIASGISACI
jgi:hypothetical protein